MTEWISLNHSYAVDSPVLFTVVTHASAAAEILHSRNEINHKLSTRAH